MLPKRSVRLTAKSGESVLFGAEGGFVFVGISGQAIPAATVFCSQAAGQHGGYRDEALLEPRTLTLSGFVEGDSRRAMDERLRQLNRVLGQLSGDLTIAYQNAAGAYVAYGTASAPVEYGGRVCRRGVHRTPVTVQLQCCRPLWYAPEWTAEQLRYNARGLKLPLKLPTTLGVGGYRRTIYNDSAAGLPLQIDILGPAATPKITNVSTRKQLALTRPLLSGERLTIDTDPEHTSVEYTDLYGRTVSALGYVDAESDPDSFEFLRLAPGENTLVFESGDDLQNATVVLRWRQAWTGV